MALTVAPASLVDNNQFFCPTVFGRMKAYFGVGRFMVRGIRNAKIETGLVMMAMNMTKMVIMAG